MWYTDIFGMENWINMGPYIPSTPENLRNAAAVKLARPSDLGPNQLQWCRDNLTNFAKYEAQAKAARGEK